MPMPDNDVDREVVQLDIDEKLNMRPDAFGGLVFELLAERVERQEEKLLNT